MERMTRSSRVPPAPALRQRLSVAAGRLTLVSTGLAALTLIALGARSLSEPPGAHPAGPAPRIAAFTPVAPALRSADRAETYGAPQVWLAALDERNAPFAAERYAQEPVLPRRSQPLPPRSETAPAGAAAIAPRLAAEPAAPQPAVAEAAPPVLAALHAPERSLVPRARPQPAVVAVAAAALPERAALTDTEAAPGAILGLARSRLPQARPEAVTRLASLDLTTPRAAAPAPTPAVLAALAPAPERATPERATPAALAPLPRAPARADSCEPALARAIPHRGRGEDEGSTVANRLTGLGGSERDNALLAEILGGNVPDFLRDLVPVTFTGTGPGGQATRVTICVTPDYLAVGSDRDFVRVPLGLPAAMRVAERFDMVLPTTRMVDAIYQQADVRLSPSPMEPGAQMASTGYFLRHNATVQGQLHQAGARLGQLVAGQKKDLVLTNRLNANPGRVAIYGWHRRNGQAIQPLSTVHGAQYADYSHGIRLVSRRAYVNGRAVDLRELLSDSRLAGLISTEGTISNRQMLAALD